MRFFCLVLGGQCKGNCAVLSLIVTGEGELCYFKAEVVKRN